MVVSVGAIVPLENENRWSDLLAVLIESDTRTAAGVFHLGDLTGRTIGIGREVVAKQRDRVDLAISVDGQLRAMIEAKVLSGLGKAQLSRYAASYPDATTRVLLFPGRLAVHPGAAGSWTAMTWETVLGAFAGSQNTWVAETARAWLAHLDTALPKLDADTRWNELRPGENFTLAMRLRMSWVYSQLDPPAPVVADFMQSGGTRAWVVRMQAPARLPGYEAGAEIEELTARNWPAVADAGVSPLKGPAGWVGLRQLGVSTSAGFDWGYLTSMWPMMAAARSDWFTQPGLPNRADKERWMAAGAPPCLGYGFGEKEAIRSGVCMFGGRFRMAPNARLGDIAAQLQQTSDLIRQMAPH